MTTREEFEQIAKSENISKNFLRTFIMGKFSVSTTYRESSACISTPPWFYETYIFQGDELIGDVTGLMSHFEVCEWIIDRGGFSQEVFDKYLEQEEADET